ncbi:MAG: hypothetical protein U1F83_14385 [Verrucomicrobiota bacterium]
MMAFIPVTGMSSPDDGSVDAIQPMLTLRSPPMLGVPAEVTSGYKVNSANVEMPEKSWMTSTG